MTVTFALTEMQNRQLAENDARLDVPADDLAAAAFFNSPMPWLRS